MLLGRDAVIAIIIYIYVHQTLINCNLRIMESSPKDDGIIWTYGYIFQGSEPYTIKLDNSDSSSK
jgi:hypothetical protein